MRVTWSSKTREALSSAIRGRTFEDMLHRAHCRHIDEESELTTPKAAEEAAIIMLHTDKVKATAAEEEEVEEDYDGEASEDEDEKEHKIRFDQICCLSDDLEQQTHS